MFAKVFFELLPFDTLIPLVYGLIFWSRLRKDMRVLVGYMAYQLVFTLAIGILRSQPGRHNLWLVNLCFPLDVYFLLILFSLWEPLIRMRGSIMGALAVYSTISYLEMWIYGADRFTAFVQPVGWTIVIVVAGITLITESRRFETGFTKQSSFWISGGLLIVGCMQITLALMNDVTFHVSVETLRYFHRILRPPAGVLQVIVFLAALVVQVTARPLVSLEKEQDH